MPGRHSQSSASSSTLAHSVATSPTCGGAGRGAALLGALGPHRGAPPGRRAPRQAPLRPAPPPPPPPVLRLVRRRGDGDGLLAMSCRPCGSCNFFLRRHCKCREWTLFAVTKAVLVAKAARGAADKTLAGSTPHCARRGPNRWTRRGRTPRGGAAVLAGKGRNLLGRGGPRGPRRHEREGRLGAALRLCASPPPLRAAHRRGGGR